MTRYGYINGQIMPVEEMQLGLSDLGILRGHGLFDYMRTYHGVLFYWDLYWARLSHSAQRMQFELPFTQNDMHTIVMDLLARSGGGDFAVRTVVTGGYSLDSMTPSTPNVVIMVEPMPDVPEHDYTNGIHVILDDYVRDMADVKTTDYKHVILKAAEMKSRQAKDLLYYKDGLISELSRSNVFIVKGQVLLTPQRDILRGITRRVVMDLAAESYQLMECDVTVDDVRQADEVFTTSSNKRILPITRIDGQAVADGRVGGVTQHLINMLQNHINQVCV
jgi:branched-chain amino acid aminotransferase